MSKDDDYTKYLIAKAEAEPSRMTPEDWAQLPLDEMERIYNKLAGRLARHLEGCSLAETLRIIHLLDPSARIEGGRACTYSPVFPPGYRYDVEGTYLTYCGPLITAQA